MGGWPVGYLQGLEELNSGPPKTNPSSGREEDLNRDLRITSPAATLASSQLKQKLRSKRKSKIVKIYAN